MKNTTGTMKFLIFIGMMLMVFYPCSESNSDAATSPNTGSRSAKTMQAVGSGPAVSENETILKEGGMSAKTLILTVNGTPVYWPEFHFWLNYIGKYYKNSHGCDKITDWTVKQNELNLREFFLSTAVGYARKDRAIEAKAKELGIKLSADDLAGIEERRNSNIKIYGGESEYRRIVASMYVSDEVFKYLTKMDYLGNYMFDYLYGAKGEKCSDKAVSAYVDKEGYMCAKYIFLSNTDAGGNALGTEKLAEKRNRMEDILGRLDASSNPTAVFDGLMKEYGEDTMISNYPDGRLFVSGGMGKEFESAFLELKENEYSGIVDTDAGSYIILRMPIFPDMATDSSGKTLRYWTAYEYLFKNQVEAWSTKMKIKYEDAYYKINVERLLE